MSTTAASRSPTADRPARTADASMLVAERDFLLRSIEDLEAEHTDGEIDDARYRELLDQYTARAAQVLRAIEATAPEPPEGASEPGDRRHRWAVPAVLAAIAVAAAALVPSALGDRPEGGTITGNAQSARPAPGLDELANRAAARPRDIAAQLGYARALLDAGEPVEALKAYDRAATLDPANAEAHAYGGWIVLLAGLDAEAMTRIDRALAADASYPDAHFFRAMALRRQGRVEEAAAELRTYLGLTPPDAPLRAEVEALLAEIEAPPSSTPPRP